VRHKLVRSVRAGKKSRAKRLPFAAYFPRAFDFRPDHLRVRAQATSHLFFALPRPYFYEYKIISKSVSVSRGTFQARRGRGMQNETRHTGRHTKRSRATSLPAPVTCLFSRAPSIQTRRAFLITYPRLETTPNPNKAKAVNEF